MTIYPIHRVSILSATFYQYRYEELIQQAQFRNWSRKSAPCYVEEHHVWPKSIGGPDYFQNLVYLTATEHYYVHYYLMRMFEEHKDDDYFKMANACLAMNNCNGYPGIDLEHEAAIYEEARIERSKNMSGDNHPFYGKNHSEETKQKQSEAKSGENNFMYGKTHSEETRNKLSEAKSGENNPKPMLGKNHSENTKQKQSEAKKGENHPRAKPISIYGIEFSTMTEAAEYFNKDISTIGNWLKSSKYLDCFYLDE